MDKKPADLPKNTAVKQPEQKEAPKKKRFPLILIILFFLFIAFCIFAVITNLFRFSKPASFGKTVLKTRPPKLKLDQRVTKKISAKDGGSVRLTSTNGYTYEVVVAPGVRKNDVTINLTPLEEAPFTYLSDPNAPNQPPDGAGTGVPEGGGTATPDDTNGKKGEDQADQAAANAGGRCSAEFIGAVLNAYGKAGTEGQKQAADRYGTLLKECEKEIAPSSGDCTETPPEVPLAPLPG